MEDFEQRVNQACQDLHSTLELEFQKLRNSRSFQIYEDTKNIVCKLEKVKLLLDQVGEPARKEPLLTEVNQLKQELSKQNTLLSELNN